eukprot:CAMPEP_0201476088 /NCGR_PEP_ID=MMETSP0151_2-20130828/1380_1 /ASSEMBLY_ACC=CAM_ASM_000257 /TAXON_ID=200890 /ORGANISM="Paramoeba atlantica, Strain 621/1 / CCAP 1560/9" /LENGTH=311 /DNA_ID=CAMNT_0047856369 /DNA_START=62 /DNA_END=997 /DNA_ORIENTATION=-
MAEKKKLKEWRICITGASGLLGRALMESFSDLNVLPLAFSRSDEISFDSHKIVKCDLTNFEETEKIIKDFEPNLIIHAAAERRLDRALAEKERAEKLNVEAVEILAKLASEIRSFLLLISTDYVFDGSNPPYKPNSKKNPLNYYGETKHRAEQALWETGHKGGILRVPLLYGRVTYPDECFLVQLASQLIEHKGEEIEFDDWQIRVPTFVDDVARVCRSLAERRARHCSLSGTWHYTASGKMTKYDMALEVAKYLQLPTENIKGKSFEDETRPKDATLDGSALNLMGMGKFTPFSDGVGIVLSHAKEKGFL